MTDMLERVARAIAHMNGDDYDAVPKHKPDWIDNRGHSQGRYRDINEPFQTDYDDMARAAVEAMREPSQGMIDAAANTEGGKAVDNLIVFAFAHNQRLPDFDKVPLVQEWQAMIDEILSEKADG